MSSTPLSTHYHIVISTRELKDINILQKYYVKHKSTDKYIISVESGKTGHKHIESFVTFSKPQRQDKVRERILKIYEINDKIERSNVKVVINKINDDVRYGYGYAWKEHPITYLSNLEKSYLDECLKYYLAEKDRVEQALAKTKISSSRMTIDSIAESFYEFCVSTQKEDTVSLISNEVASNSWEMPQMFLLYFKRTEQVIPFSLYQKINHHKLIDYINGRIQREFSDDKMG